MKKEKIEFGEDIEGENLDIPEKIDTQKIPKEMAESEFQSWADHLRLDTNEDEMDVEEKSDFVLIKKKFMYCLIKGFTQTEANGDLLLNLIDPIKNKKGIQTSEIVFRRSFKGATFVVMDRYKDNQNVHKTIAFLGAWVDIDPKELMKLDAIDLWFGMKMVSLFFGA
jgi:hypothetical protein